MKVINFFEIDLIYNYFKKIGVLFDDIHQIRIIFFKAILSKYFKRFIRFA